MLSVTSTFLRQQLTNLANAFTRSGAVKHFWNLNGSEDQLSGPAPPDDETELIRPPMFNSTWVPPTVYNTSESQSFYLNVVARSCRTCHVAFNSANWERTDPVTLGNIVRDYVCGESLAAYVANPSKVDPADSANSYVMPNSMVTFDRFWLSDRPSVVGQPPGTVSQPRVFMDHYNSLNPPDPMNPPLSCHLP